MKEDPSARRTLRSGLVTTGLAFVLLTATVGPADAIPAFARKYQTSCQTCHTAYPKLNPFGTAFRLRGYRMPGETEEMIKEEPVALGAEAYKRVWPHSVWPSSIPGTIPLSIDTQLADVTDHHGDTGETHANDFHFPDEVAILSGGTLGDTASFFGEVAFDVEAEVETEVEHAEIHFNGLWKTGSKLNIKLGRFVPEASQSFSHGTVLTTAGPQSMLGFNPIGFDGSEGIGGEEGEGGGMGIALPHQVDGVEIYGIASHRFTYSAGVANGLGGQGEDRDGNQAKDVFGRVAYKWGGLPLDGEGYQAGPKPWREKSLQIGAFGYRGNGGGIFFEGADEHAGSFVEDRSFDRYGVDLNAYLGDVNFIAGYVHGTDTLATFVEIAGDGGGEEPAAEGGEEPGDLELVSSGDFDYHAWFGEADVVFMPWLQGAVRYEFLDPSSEESDNFRRIIVNGTFLIRANVKGILEYQKDLGGLTKDDYIFKGILRFTL